MVPHSPRFRPEIDGLRMIAVLAVVLFHIDESMLVGGFLGVDVFFVISGYLITSNLMRERDKGSFSFLEFYTRRIRRLGPALLATVAVVLVLGYLLMPPSEYERVGQSAMYTMVYVANIFFWLETGYFDTDAVFKPLLHTWSLAVEEQFYLVWPALIVGLYTAAAMWRVRTAIALLFLLSLAGAVWASIHYPSASFFLMPFRIFEFAFGAFLATFRREPGSRNGLPNQVVFGLGLALIITPFFFVDGEMSYLPLWSAIPCIGATLVIWSRVTAGAGYLLNNPFSLFIGKISYSLYLTHWPAVTFWYMFRFKPFNLVDGLIVFVISLVSAIILFYLVEQRFRFARDSQAKAEGRPELGVYGAWFAASLVTVVLASNVWGSRGAPARIDEDSRALLASGLENNMECRRAATSAKTIKGSCDIGRKKAKKVSVAVIGDSHARAWLPGINGYLARRKIKGTYLGKVGAAPIKDALLFVGQRPDYQSQRLYDQVFGWLDRARPDVVVIQARWAVYWYEQRPANEVHGPPKYVTVEGLEGLSEETSRKAMIVGLRDTLTHLGGLDAEIALMGPLPHVHLNPSRCLLRPRYLLGERAAGECVGIDADTELARLAPIQTALSDLADEFDYVTYVDVATPLCEGRPACELVNGNVLLYRDDDHLSGQGSKLVFDRHLKRMFDRLFADIS